VERVDATTIERERRLKDVISKLPRAKLVFRQDVTDDLMVIKLEPQIPFTFKAGQYCTLGLDSLERAYSIASAPHEPYLEIFVELVPPPDGALTPLMWGLRVGDPMSIRPRAKGIFTMDERYHHHLMVATVTGIAPFMSTIRSYLDRGAEGHKFYVLQGASYHDEFTYKDEMEALAKDHPDSIVYIPTVSRPTESYNQAWQGVTGRVNSIVEDFVKEHRLDSQGTLIYACGHPGMIEDVHLRLAPLGFKVKEERYWKQ
jgi:ferredoxin--NADP+ reductase